jgi:hypothetical protein
MNVAVSATRMIPAARALGARTFIDSTKTTTIKG